MNVIFARHVMLYSAMLSIILTGCSSPTSIPDALRLTEKDSGSYVELIVGQNMQLSLDANPTTGYTWEVTQSDAGVLDQVGNMEYNPDSNAIGSGGTMTFRFHAAKTGETTLRLIYQRPHEKDKPPLKTFEVAVTVFLK
jgi:inhibitor of cysteine peptidase